MHGFWFTAGRSQTLTVSIAFKPNPDQSLMRHRDISWGLGQRCWLCGPGPLSQGEKAAATQRSFRSTSCVLCLSYILRIGWCKEAIFQNVLTLSPEKEASAMAH